MPITQSLIKVVIADDHICVREGLTRIIESSPDFVVCAAAADGEMLIRAVRQYKPDLVMSDLRMPGMSGLDAGIIIKKEFPEIALIAYLADKSDFLFSELLGAGFDGIILKEAGKKETITVMNIVVKGNCFSCRAAETMINTMIQENRFNPKRRTVHRKLSDREIQVLKLLCHELTSKEIALEMKLRERTINCYRERLLKKTGCINVAGLVSYAYVAGIVHPMD